MIIRYMTVGNRCHENAGTYEELKATEMSDRDY
jgi:hypothetical protein